MNTFLRIPLWSPTGQEKVRKLLGSLAPNTRVVVERLHPQNLSFSPELTGFDELTRHLDATIAPIDGMLSTIGLEILWTSRRRYELDAQDPEARLFIEDLKQWLDQTTRESPIAPPSLIDATLWSLARWERRASRLGVTLDCAAGVIPDSGLSRVVA